MANNADDNIALFLKAQNPTTFAGWKNDKVVKYAREKDPGFDSYANKFYGSSVSANGPLDSAIKATQPIRDIVSGGINAINNIPMVKEADNINFAGERLLNRGLGWLSDSADKTADKISLAGKDQIASDMYRTISHALDLAHLPESSGEATATAAMGAGGALAGDLMSRIASGEKLALPSAPKAVYNPFTKSIQTVQIPDADALSKTDFISTPEVHNQLAKDHIEALGKSTKLQSDNNYNKLGDLVGNLGTMQDLPIDVTDASRIANNAPAELMQHPDFQTAAMRKIRRILASEPQESNGVQVGPQPGSDVDWHDLEPSGSNMKAQEVVQLMKSLNKTISSNYKNPTGNLAEQLKGSLDSAFQKDAPDILKDAHAKATSGYKDYMDTFHNKDVESFMKAQSDKAHALPGTDSLNAIRNAGGEVAIEHLRRSAAYDLYGKIVDQNLSGTQVDSLFRRNRMLDNLMSNGDYDLKTADRFAKIADDRLAAIAEANKTSLPQKVVNAVRNVGVRLVGGAAAGPMGSAAAGEIGDDLFNK